MTLRLSCDGQGEAVQEVVVDDGQPPTAGCPPPGLQPHPHRQTVFVRQRHGQVQDIGTAAVGQDVPVRMGGRQSAAGHHVDLRAQLPLDVLEARLGQQLWRGGAGPQQPVRSRFVLR